MSKFKFIFPFLLIFLFPLFFVIHGFVQNGGLVPFSALISLFLKFILITAFLFFVFGVIFRNNNKAAAAVFISCVFYCYFGYYHELMQELFHGSWMAKYRFIFPTFLLTYVLLIRVIYQRVVTAKLVLFINVLLLLWLFIDVVSLTLLNSKRQPDPEVSKCAECLRPDVYLIVIDGYAGKEQLKNDFSFDNNIFYKTLDSLGFHFPVFSRANYARTEFSIASLLNMEYDHLPDHAVTPATLEYCYEKIASNKTTKLFKAAGYRLVNYSIFDISGQEAVIKNKFLLNGKQRIENSTLTSRINTDIMIPSLLKKYSSSRYHELLFQVRSSDSVIEKRLAAFKTLPGRPSFIYTHLLYTHFPYYLKENGDWNDDSLISFNNYGKKDLYLSNLKASNNRILDLVKNILADARVPPVIFLISDHGFRYNDNPSNSLSNLATFYFPPNMKINIPDTVTNVNLFRIFFHEVLKQDLPLLENRHEKFSVGVKENKLFD
jgi:hypothetical protein